MASWLGERVSLPVALHAQCAALVALRGRESVYQHAVLHAWRAIRIWHVFCRVDALAHRVLHAICAAE